MKLKLITTSDGSHSLLREDMNETYHSFHGAYGESMHVFIKQGLQYFAEQNKKSKVKVFEVGFGTGLNALITADYAEKHALTVDFFTLEPYPVPAETYQQLNYGEDTQQKDLLQQMHDAPWGEPVEITKLFKLHKSEDRLEDYHAEQLVDIIYFDAFAPSKQAEVWQLANLQKCFDMLNPGGILTTYCAQGQFKRNLAEAGFEVQTLEGALGKKEMVRGVKFGH